MINTKLKQMIKNSGYKKSHFASILGINISTFSKKLNGSDPRYKFKKEEKTKIIEFLK